VRLARLQGTVKASKICPMDEIRLTGLTFFGFHGANPEETTLGQRFVVDAALSVDLSRAAQSDDLRDTVSYSSVFKFIRSVVEGEPSQLLESVAGKIASGLLGLDERIESVHICVTKPAPPLKGSTAGAASVCINRSRA
jgi:dihydroneopterin aldolase